MLGRETKYKLRFECPECTQGVSCPVCTEKTKTLWYEEIPARYKDASLNNIKALGPKKMEIIDNFTDVVLNHNHKNCTGLYVHGNLGTGKTWLLYGVAKKLIEKANPRISSYPPFHVEDCKTLVFKFHCRYTGRGENTIDAYIREFVALTKNYLLILDDLGHGNTTKDDFAMNIYNLLIDAIYVNMGFVAISSNYSPPKLKDYIGSYAVDRIMEMCGDNVIEIEGRSQRIG
jgi:DNA replication protein DnaC